MTSPSDKPNRWRPKFSVRTLVVVVTLLCCYAACWGPTKRWGVDDVVYRGWLPNDVSVNASAVAPLIVAEDFIEQAKITRGYYLWFFGYVVELPHGRELTSFSITPHLSQ